MILPIAFPNHEILFLVEKDSETGYTARALDHSIFTQADDLETLRFMVRDAVLCHFPESGNRPQIIRWQIVQEELLFDKH